MTTKQKTEEIIEFLESQGCFNNRWDYVREEIQRVIFDGIEKIITDTTHETPCVHPWAHITFDYDESGRPIKANCGICKSRFWR